MRIVALSAIILLAVAAAEVPPLPPTFYRSDAPALEIRTSILPVTHDSYQLLKRVTPGMYRCQVYVLDHPGSDHVWAAQDVVLGPGESSEKTSAWGPIALTFKVKIEKSLDHAETTVTVSRDSKVISKQVSTVWLERPPAWQHVP